MKKSNANIWIVLAAFLVAYHAIAFLIPFPKGAIFWLSYGFTLAAFAVAAGSFVIAFAKPDAKSRFYGFPIARIGFVYWAVQLVAGIVFMALGKVAPWWLAALVYVLALSAAAVGLIVTDTVVQEIHSQDEKIKKNVSLMRSLQSKVGQLTGQCDDLTAADAIKAFAEALRYSDPVSGEASAEAEAELSALVEELQRSVLDGDAESVRKLCRRATAVLAERNRLCKLDK